jgi:hypothetical protein
MFALNVIQCISQATTPNIGQFINQPTVMSISQFISKSFGPSTNQHIGQSMVSQVTVVVMGGVKSENATRANRIIDKKDKDATLEARQVVGKKPHQI